MKALTVWQPWASLIAAGVKPYEFRGWHFPRFVKGQRIVIHAAARKVKIDEIDELIERLEQDGGWGLEMDAAGALTLLRRWRQWPETPPLSTGVCTALLHAAVPARELPSVRSTPDRVNEINERMFGWHLKDIQPLPLHDPVKGAQGFWDWPLPPPAP